ncbi:DnaJ domain, zinc finger, CCHC-type, tetratricopeptide-like helical domain protein [Tanacetum coccineum]
MDGVGVRPVKEVVVGVDALTEEEYVKGLALCLSNVIFEDYDGGLNVEWAPFPNEVTGASLIMPSPSGSKLLASEHDEIEANFFVERAALERKYQKLYEPLYSKKFDLFSMVCVSSCHLVLGEIDEALLTNNIKLSIELLQLKMFESATNAMEIVTEALLVICYSDKLLNLKDEALFQLHKYEEVVQMCKKTFAIAEKELSYCHMGKLDKALSMLEKYEQLAPFETTTEEPSLYLAVNVHELLQIKVKDIALKLLKWVKVGGYIFFNALINLKTMSKRAIGNTSASLDFTPRFFKEFHVSDVSGSSYEFSLVETKSIGASADNKINENHIMGKGGNDDVDWGF